MSSMVTGSDHIHHVRTPDSLCFGEWNFSHHIIFNSWLFTRIKNKIVSN